MLDESTYIKLYRQENYIYGEQTVISRDEGWQWGVGGCDCKEIVRGGSSW